MGIYFPGPRTMGLIVWSGLGSFASEVSLLIFLQHTWMCITHSVSPCLSMSLRVSMPLWASLRLYPFLCIWMNVASLNPWLLDFYLAWFSENSGWLLFFSQVVIFVLVMWGAKVCLSTPPSWPLSFILNQAKNLGSISVMTITGYKNLANLI